ncbi:MAG: hypothetical protein VYE41_03405 [Candidatus Neomarinimicrobiota bacterium]|nr:hypothetical protein [Candidatus Neomarinimicrobiota bacterium]
MKYLSIIFFISISFNVMSCSLNPMSLLRRDKQVEPETNVEAEVPVQAKANAQARSLKEESISQTKKIPAQRMQSRRPRLTVEPLPEGWTVDRHPVAKWGMSLPTVMSNVLDSAQSVEYWEEVIDLPTGYKLPLKRAKVYFQIVTRLTIESVELHFMNINHIYSSTNHEPSHYIMNGIVRGVELKPTGFPQLTADDIIKYKFLMTYGTPKEFSGGFHNYESKNTILKVRDLDSRHVQIQMNSPEVDKKLLIAIDDMYSEEGIEYQKKLLLRSIDF